MRTAVLDIETAGLPWLDLDVRLRRAVTRGAAGGDAYRQKKDLRSLSPYTAQVIVVALLDPEEGRGTLWYDDPGGRVESASADGRFRHVGTDEVTLLSETWDALAGVERVVTFNGRSFDGPFLSVRSAVHGVRPSRNLTGARFALREHVDLIEVLTFFGAVTKPSLHAACAAFGIPSPKSAGLSGEAVGEAYRQGRLAAILDYCRRDVEATAALLARLETTLLPLLGA